MVNAVPLSPKVSPSAAAQTLNDSINRAWLTPLPLRELSEAAIGEDADGTGIERSIGLIAKAGCLQWRTLPVPILFSQLVSMAEVNLPVARLYEGHVNALRLVRSLADPAIMTDVQRDADAGLLYGVWGAEGATALATDGPVLVGGKRFASGLGTVSRAVVTIGQGETVRLALLLVTDVARHRPETWRKTGMRATVSGDFDAGGLPLDALHWIGAPGDYLKEPGFIGGVWRIAAVQVGGTMGLLRAAADHLAILGRLGAEAQVTRLAPVLTRALAAADFTLRAAVCAEGPEGLRDPERAASLSAQARLLTEDVGQDAIACVERAVGLPHFDMDAPTGRMARDLATYMRQAARDALMHRSGSWALNQPGAYSKLLNSGGSDAGC